jgi:glycosyltransferase involved in cell wall biosynthesis
MGGTIRTALNLAGHLASRYDVEVVSLARWRPEPFFTFPPGVRVTVLHDAYVEHSRVWWLMRRLLRRLPSRLINVEDYGYPHLSLWTDLLIMNHLRGLTGVLIGTRPGLNIVAARYAPRGVRTIGQEHMNLDAHRPLLRADIKRFYPGLDALAVLTATDLRDYSDFFGSGPPPVLQIPNAVTVLDGGQADMSAKVVVAAGRLSRQKALHRLIRAWQPVARAHPDWELRIYGDGPERPRLDKLIVDLGLSGNARTMGRTDRLGHAFAESSIFALSSVREGMPMVILEAMSKGLPVVSFDCPTGPAELIETGHNGVLVPDGNIEALSAALQQVIEDDDLRLRLAKGAFETSGQYAGNVIGKRWVELVENLRAGRAGAQLSAGR